jgi:amino acid transporter
MLTITGMIYLRYKKPNLKRPIKVHIAIPITFLLLCAFLVFLPVYVRPFECGMAVLITLTGIPFYAIFNGNKSPTLKSLTLRVTKLVQKVFLSLPEQIDSDENEELPAKS